MNDAFISEDDSGNDDPSGHGGIVPDDLRPAQFRQFFLAHCQDRVKDLAHYMSHVSSREEFVDLFTSMDEQFDQMKGLLEQNVDTSM